MQKSISSVISDGGLRAAPTQSVPHLRKIAKTR
jgi:hypothetical protein